MNPKNRLQLKAEFQRFGSNDHTLITSLLREAGYDLVSGSSTFDLRVNFVNHRLTKMEKILQGINGGMAALGSRDYQPVLSKSDYDVLQKLLEKDSKNIWITGENVRPPAVGWEGTLSFDFNGANSSNFYFPLWMQIFSYKLDSPTPWSQFAYTESNLMNSRQIEKVPSSFATVVVNRMNEKRAQFIDRLSELGKVDIFGAASGKYLKSKAELSNSYKFVFCFENDLYPGYVTEKVFDAWLMGGIPIWWGLDPAGYVNKKAVINHAHHLTVEQTLDEINQLANDKDKWLSKINEPILMRRPDWDGLIQWFRTILEHAK